MATKKETEVPEIKPQTDKPEIERPGDPRSPTKPEEKPDKPNEDPSKAPSPGEIPPTQALRY